MLEAGRRSLCGVVTGGARSEQHVVNAGELKGGFYFWSGVDYVGMAADRTSATNCPYQSAYSLGIDAFDAAKVNDDRHPSANRIVDFVSK
jgi:hypothetical protein